MSKKTGTLYWLPIILDDERLDATETLLMVALADHVDGDDWCFAGIVGLAKQARCSYGTARRHLKVLEDQGRIVRKRQRREDGNLSVYEFRLVREDAAPPRILRADEGEPARAQVRDDQRAPRCAMTSARPGARAEPPRVEPPRVEPKENAPDRTSALTLLPDPVAPAAPAPMETLLGFSEFWAIYPKRNGKRLGRRLCEGLWAKLPLDDRRAAWRGARHYADAVEVDLTIAKDPERWLKHRAWEDWQEPATPDPQRANGARLSNVEQSWSAIGRVFGVDQGGME